MLIHFSGYSSAFASSGSSNIAIKHRQFVAVIEDLKVIHMNLIMFEINSYIIN